MNWALTAFHLAISFFKSSVSAKYSYFMLRAIAILPYYMKSSALDFIKLTRETELWRSPLLDG